jgi:hypothetical protein
LCSHEERAMSGFQLPVEHTLDRIIPLQEAQKLSGLSPDSWKRNHPEKIIKLSPRRVGIRLRDALMLGKAIEEARR